jgi:signal peptidase I
MKPTFNDQEIAETRSYTPISKLFYRLGRGDVVVFNSGRTIKEGNSVDYIKRVVALPNDEIEIRDGYLYINGELANESYLLKSRSTFGDDFLKECQKLKIPNGYYFVLGDNRKRSEDSRKIGLVADSEITSVLPFSEQQKFKNRWNISNGVEDWAGLPTFNPSKYYDKLNSARKERGLKPYKANARLEEAAKLRVEIILQNNELGIDSKQSKLPPERAYSEAGYYNTKTGEIRGTGYFDEEELLGYWLEYSGTQSFVFDEEFQETGIAAVVGKINGCETQMIVQEFGAYIPPNYSKDTIQSWESSLSSLKEIQPGWEGLKNNLSFYDKNRADVDRITQIISIRITNITAIVGRMKANQWLAAGEQAMVDQDKALYDEQEAIAKRLNNQ